MNGPLTQMKKDFNYQEVARIWCEFLFTTESQYAFWIGGNNFPYPFLTTDTPK